MGSPIKVVGLICTSLAICTIFLSFSPINVNSTKYQSNTAIKEMKKITYLSLKGK